MVQSKNLFRYKNKVFSQHGEDGMIDELISNLPEVYKYSVEVGAANGIRGSNTRAFLESGWKSMYIEADPILYKELCNNTKDYDAICIQTRVSLEIGENLNDIFKEHNVPSDFDLLSLDIDGNDYWVWKYLNYKPKIVVIEYNGELEDQNYIQQYHKDGHQALLQGTPLATGAIAMEKLGKELGYDLVGMTRPNMIFIRSDLNKLDNEKFDIIDAQYWRDVNHILFKKLYG